MRKLSRRSALARRRNLIASLRDLLRVQNVSKLFRAFSCEGACGCLQKNLRSSASSSSSQRPTRSCSSGERAESFAIATSSVRLVNAVSRILNGAEVDKQNRKDDLAKGDRAGHRLETGRMIQALHKRVSLSMTIDSGSTRERFGSLVFQVLLFIVLPGLWRRWFS
jgi:hypothetical protein